MAIGGATLQKLAKEIEAKDHASIAADAAVLKRNFARPVGTYFKGAKNAESGGCHKAWRVPLPDKTFEIKTN